MLEPEALKKDVLHHLHEMNTALETAWQMRPDDDPEMEAELIGMLMMADMLEREVKSSLPNGLEEAVIRNAQSLGDA